MSRFECDDDVFSPARCVSLDNSISCAEDSLIDISTIDSSVLSAKDFTEFQSKPSNEPRYIEKRSCSSSFSGVNDQEPMNFSYSSGAKSASPNHQQNTSGPSKKSDANDFLHKLVLNKDINLQNVNIRNKEASKNAEKCIDSAQNKKKYHTKVKENDEIKTFLDIANSRTKKNKAKTHCLNESNILSVSEDSNSSYLHENRKFLVTSATQTELSFEELVSSSNSNIYKKSVVMDEKDECSTDVPLNHYQLSVKKIIHDAVSTECDKIRQLLYAQRMSSFRRIDQILAQHEFRVMMMQERLLKTVEELARIHVLLNKSNTE